LDSWDPRIVDPIAKNHHVITFDNRGVGASSGQVPKTVEAMADDAYTFIKALGYSKIDIFSFSLGGFVAQALVVKHPDLVRKLPSPAPARNAVRTSTRSPAPPTSTSCGRP
jgi:pimeloyl-ACP methyl ester carboxylesterase